MKAAVKNGVPPSGDAGSLGCDFLRQVGDQRAQWMRRPALRAIYHDCFRRMLAEMARDATGGIGKSIELGSGGGYFKEICPRIITTDVLPSPWADAVIDAADMPFEEGSVRNLVLFDVLHHLCDIPSFLSEAARVLEPRGRVVIVDPYISPLSRVIYGLFHREPIRVTSDPLADHAAVGAAPMDGNQGIAREVFFKSAGRLGARWPTLTLVTRRRLSLLSYPLSGGFSGPTLLPAAIAQAAVNVERALEPLLGRWLAFRCLVVLERRERPIARG